MPNPQVPKGPQYTVEVADNFVVEDESSTIIYGDSGIGKSTLARSWPRPLFLMMRGGGEHRPMPLAGTGIPFIEINEKAQMDAFILDVTRDGKLPTVSVMKKLPDSLVGALNAVGPDGQTTELYEPKTLVVDQLPTLYNIYGQNLLETVQRNRDNPETLSLQDFGQARQRMLRMFYDLNNIPHVHKVYLCLAEIDEDFKTKERMGLPMLAGKLAKEVCAFVDFVFRLHARREVKNNKLRQFRAIQTAATDTWFAKDSSGRLDELIEIPDPDFRLWDFIVQKVKA